MARLFENFIRNFYKIEQKQFEVSNPKIAWQIISFSEDADSYLPEMRTDICLANEKRKIIIDCKFYKETFQKSYDRKTIHSQHLYQLISYLINKETDIDWEYCEGILLYPVIDGDVECESRVEIKDAKSMTYRH